MTTKPLAIGLLSLAGLGLMTQDASAFFWNRHCHRQYCAIIRCRPYNAFSPCMSGRMTYTGCCPFPCGQDCGWNPGLPMPSMCGPDYYGMHGAAPMMAAAPAPGPALMPPPGTARAGPPQGPPPPGYIQQVPGPMNQTSQMMPGYMPYPVQPVAYYPAYYPGYYPAYPQGYYPMMPPAYGYAPMPGYGQ